MVELGILSLVDAVDNLSLAVDEELRRDGVDGVFIADVVGTVDFARLRSHASWLCLASGFLFALYLFCFSVQANAFGEVCIVCSTSISRAASTFFSCFSFSVAVELNRHPKNAKQVGDCNLYGADCNPRQ